MKSYRISQSYDFAYYIPNSQCILHGRSCLLYPMRFHMPPCACPGQFKCDPGTTRSCSDAPQFESNSTAARPVRLSVFFCLEIGLQWFTNPFQASLPPVSHPAPPFPRLGGFFVGLLSSRSTTVGLWPGRGGIPLHKLTLKIRSDLRVGHKLQVLENDVCVCLSKACCAGIAGPGGVRGNHDQAGEVGDLRGPSRRTEEVLDSP